MAPEDLSYMTEHMPPFTFKENGKITGFSMKLLRLVWKQMGVEPQSVWMLPWARAYIKLKNEENAVLFTISRSAHREHFFKWVCPITFGSRHVFLAKKERKIKISSLEDSKKYVIGTVIDDVVEQTLIQNGFKESELHRVSSLIQNVQKLKQNRIDLIAQSEASINGVIIEYGFDPNLYESVYLIMQVQSCFAFNPAVPDTLINKFQSALDQVRLSDEFLKMKEEFKLH